MYADYNARLLAANPRLRDEGTMMRLSVKAFLKTIEAAYLAGQADERDARKAADDFARVQNPDRPTNPFGDVLGKMFGV